MFILSKKINDMKVKKKILIIIFLIILGVNAMSKGIIMASDKEILETFRDYNAIEIKNLSNEISKEYDKVILHLGSQYVFRKGGPFFYRTSQNNLKIFSKQLKNNGVKVYFWFLDSFGGDGFLDIYNSHEDIIDKNIENLQEQNIYYDGIVIDLEWINYGGYDNKNKYLEILKYLRDKINSKKLYSFASIIESPIENQKRGYTEDEIKKISNGLIAMLYPMDGGFYLEKGILKLFLNDNRIDSIKKYSEKNNYQIAYSVIGGVIINKENNLYKVKDLISVADIDLDDTTLIYKDENKYYSTYGFEVVKSKKIKRNDGIIIELKKGDKFYILEIDKSKLDEKYFIWEYFQLNK